MMGLIEDIGGDNEIERAEIVGEIPPVEDPRPQAGDRIALGVVAHPLEGRLLVVGGGDGEAGPGGDDRRQPQAAAELEERPPTPIHGGQILGEDDRRLPHVGPVGDPLVGLEGRQVDERLHVRGAPDRHRPAADVDPPLHRLESIKSHRPPFP